MRNIKWLSNVEMYLVAPNLFGFVSKILPFLILSVCAE